jgi:hypothetical protein
MRIDALIRLLAAASLLLLLTFVHAMADPVSDPVNGDPDKPAQPSAETSITQPGEKSAEGGDSIQPFVPSESVPAGSAVKFPVDI